MRFGVATRPKDGETANGDAYFVREFDSKALMAVIDGIGHGKEANIAAMKAVSFLEKHYCEDLTTIVKKCHEELRGTRGAVLGVALIKKKENILSYAGVGNISARIVKRGEESHLTSMDGIVGYNLRKVREFQYPYSRGDIVLMFSDGISHRFSISGFLMEEGVQKIAEDILQENGKNDDATVLVVR